uniref:Uncharacterized protein n=1 Tax=Onchocerca volvulus TaxID=6282 RepID=A0A8R1Y4R6_ONCVO
MKNQELYCRYRKWIEAYKKESEIQRITQCLPGLLEERRLIIYLDKDVLLNDLKQNLILFYLLLLYHNFEPIRNQESITQYMYQLAVLQPIIIVQENKYSRISAIVFKVHAR